MREHHCVLILHSYWRNEWQNYRSVPSYLFLMWICGINSGCKVVRVTFRPKNPSLILLKNVFYSLFSFLWQSETSFKHSLWSRCLSYNQIWYLNLSHNAVHPAEIKHHLLNPESNGSHGGGSWASIPVWCQNDKL